ncbi:M14 family zinc carboxypeptidase [Saccharothrix obliqua]|uniref:M14 family zinc carboxypeptidase n=1 Tax=Saccharothrix obliqua TaxID=2861747 RepID=UPI001C5F6B53|nr:M14 family zinc carboxypeptidase [Saccharothrix obliqua]MBW4721802.1 peptidase M14 [Saccharothrix obliqua]
MPARRRPATLIALSTLALLVGAVPAHAGQVQAEQALPAPTCSEKPRELPVHEFTDHRELGVELDRVARTSAGRVRVDLLGRSNRGREIWGARVGTGRKVVLLTSEIHGNEKTGTDALLSLLDWVGTSDSAKARRWRSELTIVAVPKMNPDAAELDRRANDMTWDEVTARFPHLRGSGPSWNYYTGSVQGDDYSARPGFDINRDYHPNLDYVPRKEDFPGTSTRPGWYISPETRIIRDVYRGLTAEFGKVDTYIDLHHQGACYVMPDDHDRFVTLSISGKFVDNPATTPGLEEYAGKYDLDYSKRLNVAVHNALQAAAANRPVFGNVTLYPQDTNLPGTGLGSFALNGSGTVLFEVRGQTQTLGQQHRATLTRAVYIGLDGVLSSIASGQVHQLSPADYDRIPPRGPNIGEPGEDGGHTADDVREFG